MKRIDRLFVVLPPLSKLGPSAFLKRSVAEQTVLQSRLLYGRKEREVVEFARIPEAAKPKPKTAKKKTGLSRVQIKKATRK